MPKVIAFLNAESGAAAAEYVLILAVLGAATVAAVTNFGGDLSDALNRAAATLSNFSF
ncbi:Flp family type IVb pilin [Phenylobacterium montanum]|uniref:Flp family type IVb pilin n=1 Tax=Phenylobacterium montanum TaxID=2823693 RepID=A0A975G237_9CAUL|nr:Flp family type IVb pilin [Caulobacter sp. S6]QUD88586.1 Flp family type IVb pilin [Caulobacter sp. S6]